MKQLCQTQINDNSFYKVGEEPKTSTIFLDFEGNNAGIGINKNRLILLSHT